jgi:flagellar motor switch/type III secretory pathway protein FliN
MSVNEEALVAQMENLRAEAILDGPKDGSQKDVNLDVILDVPVTLSMEVGRAHSDPQPAATQSRFGGGAGSRRG